MEIIFGGIFPITLDLLIKFVLCMLKMTLFLASVFGLSWLDIAYHHAHIYSIVNC